MTQADIQQLSTSDLRERVKDEKNALAKYQRGSTTNSVLIFFKFQYQKIVSTIIS